MQPQSLNEEKLIPLDTSGDNIDVELNEETKEQNNEKTVEVKEEVNNKILKKKALNTNSI